MKRELVIELQQVLVKSAAHKARCIGGFDEFGPHKTPSPPPAQAVVALAEISADLAKGIADLEGLIDAPAETAGQCAGPAAGPKPTKDLFHEIFEQIGAVRSNLGNAYRLFNNGNVKEGTEFLVIGKDLAAKARDLALAACDAQL